MCCEQHFDRDFLREINMAAFKKIVAATIATDGSVTSGFHVPGEFSHFSVMIPTATAWCVTATCQIRILGADSATGTYREIGYSNNPATATSGFRAWDTGGDGSGKLVICEALQFAPGFAKIQAVNTATASTEFVVYARKFD